jgi:GT2 family glycosyltransferase
MVVRAEAIRKVGGFLPELGPGRIGLGEETELSLRMRQAGCRLLYAPQILIHHCLPRKRLSKALFRKRFFQQGRAAAYYEPLPASLLRFAVYVVKDSIFKEALAIRHLCAGRSALALRCQCEAYSQAGLLWQHWLLKRGELRRLPAGGVSPPNVEA